MSNVDTSKLSYSELVELSKQLDQQISERRSEELKVLVDGFVKKMEAAGFTVAEAIHAMQPYSKGPSTPRVKFGSSAPVLYKDPANPQNTWSGRGRAAKWLADYEVQGRKRDEFKVGAA